jgi:hypothetical protein
VTTVPGRIHPDGTLTARVHVLPGSARVICADTVIDIPPGAVALDITLTRDDHGHVNATAEPVYAQEPAQ